MIDPVPAVALDKFGPIADAQMDLFANTDERHPDAVWVTAESLGDGRR